MRYTKEEIEAACNLLNACGSQEEWEEGLESIGGDFSWRVIDLASHAMMTLYHEGYYPLDIEPDQPFQMRALEAEYRLREGWLPREEH